MPVGNPPAESAPVRPLLTIGIPTYNRRPFVEKLLESLAWEFERMDRAVVDRIEILVSNNDSRDDTGNLLEAMKKRLPNLQVHTQSQNLGPYENIITCVERARGEWVWTHGDDDVSVPSGLASLVQLLVAGDSDYVILYDSRFKRPYAGEYRGRLKEFVRFCSETEPYLLLEHSLITSNVFRKNLFAAEDMRKWVATDYGHLYSLMRRGLAADARVCVPAFNVFSIPEDRPPFECWPENIDKSWRDYLVWLGEQTGVKIDVNRAMDYTRNRLKNELKHPLRFIRKNSRNIFRPGAYPFLIKRLLTLFYKKG
jgi:glycosyltransferase involved in cell wall biosynthesis